MDVASIHRTACDAARDAGALVRRMRELGSVEAHLKDGHELVTQADLASDHLIRTLIQDRFPGHSVISEESWDGWQEGMFDGPVWVVDPLDGTVNYALGQVYCSVSVAFALDGVVLAGAVVGPFLGQAFKAVKAGGARLNGRPLAVSHPAFLREAVVGTGFPHRRDALDEVIERVRRLLASCRDLRRTASPALDICWVGAGMLDAHTESLAPWDVAAAGLIATEAGAQRATLLPQPFPLPLDLASAGYLVAAPSIFEDLVELLT